MKPNRRNAPKASRQRKIKSRLTPDELADCRTFARLYTERKNEADKNPDGPAWNYVYLEKLSGISQNSWGAYANGSRALTMRAMTWIETFYDFPAESFRCWPSARASESSSIIGAIAQLPESERTALANLLSLLLKTPKKHRAKIIQNMRRAVRARTFVKVSSS